MTRKSAGPFDAQRRAEQARRLLAEKRAALDLRMAEARQRMEGRRAIQERRLAELAARLAERRGRSLQSKPFRSKRPPGEEDGEPAYAVPRPKPKPLSGGAAAPLDRERRKLAGLNARKGDWRGRVPSDAETRQSL